MNGLCSLVRRATPILAAALFACGGNDGGQADDSAKAAADSATMKDMPGMAGMMVSDSMMAQMHAHMQVMDTASAASLQAMLPMHRQMVANMLSGMTADMRSMNMTGDAAWTATSDSVRQDLVRMPDMTPEELKRATAAHHARVMRLMDLHRKMMSPR